MNLPEEAVEALAREVHATSITSATPWELLSEDARLRCRSRARRFLAVVAPALRKQGAEEARDELERLEKLAAERLQDKEAHARAADARSQSLIEANRRREDAERERDQALAKGAEEERERLERFQQVTAQLAESLKSHMGQNCGGCSASKALADYAALDTPDPSEPEERKDA